MDEVLWEFFSTDIAKGAVRSKVETLYPDHEIDQFTDLFWDRIQEWRGTKNTATKTQAG